MVSLFGPLWIACLALFLIGMALLIMELFLPGFGVSGICGILCLVAVIVIQFMTNRPSVAWIVTGAVLLILLIMIVLFMHSMKNGMLFRSPIVLKEQIEAEAIKPSSESLEPLIGKTGTALTPLRPSGIALIDGKRYSVETQATFVDKGAEVTVLGVDGTKITVR